MSDRLFRQDFRIVVNTVRSAFGGWFDRVAAALLLLVALTAMRSWFVSQSWQIAAWTALASSIGIGFGAGRLVSTRLTSHGADGLLAADALHPPTRHRYHIRWHGIALALLATIAVVIRPSLLLVCVPAYLFGALSSRLTTGFSAPARVGTRAGWQARAWLGRPGAGVTAAAVLLLSLLPAMALGPTTLLALTGIETILLATTITVVDDRVVRFMAIAGQGSRCTVARHARGITLFAVIEITGCWLIVGPAGAAIAAAASVAMLLIMAVRILAYRLHAKHFADLLVVVVVAVLMLVAYSMPVALPLAVLAIVWHLAHRARTKTWLVA